MKNNEYPENREWKQKAFGMPKLPSGDIGQDKVLYYILKMVKDGKSANTMLNIEGSNSTATLGRMCEWIRPIGLVNKEKQVWTLTELGEMVLERQDSYFSTAVFCSTIVFMGEILFYLQEPKNSQELLKIAEEYHLNWKTNSEIHNRIKWFRDVDMVRFEEYKLEYSLTKRAGIFAADRGYYAVRDRGRTGRNTSGNPASNVRMGKCLKACNNREKKNGDWIHAGKNSRCMYNNQRIFAIDESGDFYRRDSGVFES